ncbi:MAG: hypothetical protein ACI9H6_000033 [Patiriisocius sp.]|jgi:hypothetical protein
MLARNLVMKEGFQSVTLKATDILGGYTVIDNSIHILYALHLNWEGNGFLDWDENRPFLVSVKADEFLVNQTDYDSEISPFLAWASARARELVDQRVFEHDWSIRLSDSGSKGYFKISVESITSSKIKVKMVQDMNFLWECFFSPNSNKLREIEAQYAKEAA